MTIRWITDRPLPISEISPNVPLIGLTYAEAQAATAEYSIPGLAAGFGLCRPATAAELQALWDLSPWDPRIIYSVGVWTGTVLMNEPVPGRTSRTIRYGEFPTQFDDWDQLPAEIISQYQLGVFAVYEPRGGIDLEILRPALMLSIDI